MLKKPLFCALIASTSVGYAQANVTLYGVVDSGITYISNEGGSSSTQVKDGVLMGSRLGFRGQEDLGGGYKVAFTLEQGINLNTGALGQGGLGFGRQAFLAFKTPYGDVSLGRQYDFMQKYLNPLNIGGWATTYAGHHGDLDRISGNRVNSAIRYDSPDVNGLTFGAMYANKTSSSLQTFSGGAGYKGDGWSLAFAYFRQKGNTFYPDLQMGFSDFLGVAMSGKGTPVTLDKQETIALGGSYKLGDITLKANTTTTSMELGSEKERQKVFEFGAQIPVSERVTAFAAWQHSRMAGYTWNQPTVGGWYNLSKRTWIYNAYSYMKASKGIAANQGAGFYFGNSSNNKQGSIRLGLIHMF